MAAQKHTHRYYKIKLQYVEVWACSLPNCTHYVPPHLSALMLGKSSLCWSCGHEFLLDEERKEHAIEGRPICRNCELKQKGVDLEVVEHLLE